MNDIRMHVLLVDDEKNIRNTLRVSLATMNCEVSVAATHEEAVAILKKEPIDFILTDFRLESGTGLDLIRASRKLAHSPVSAVMTAYASFENAVQAIKEGAFDYLPKPFSNAQLNHLLQKVRTVVALKRENRRLKHEGDRSDYFAGMTSVAMTRLEEFVRKVAPTDATVLLTGESGTGKSELARIIHASSKRSGKPFQIINCTTLTESLLESELFGHVKGAFTGATQDHVGKLEAANHGTAFIDEVGDLSITAQTKLLRFLQEKTIERVGSNRSIPLDVRVIAATNKNLEEAVKAGQFREDLYFRLNVFECQLVPLRFRKEDLPVLIERFLRESSAAALKEPRPVPEAIRKLLLSYPWPGNIRELRNAMERLVLLSSDKEMEIEDLPESIKNLSKWKETSSADPVYRTLEEVEREQIERVLSRETNQERAAEILGITTVTLWRKRKQYGLP